MKEVERITEVYSQYDGSSAHKKLYTPFGPYAYFNMTFLRECYTVFRQRGFATLADKKILLFGCGRGNELADFYKMGAVTGNLTGIDLLHRRLQDAQKQFPQVAFINGDGVRLPVKDKQFNIITQLVVFSSILDDTICRQVAGELMRVLTDDGLLIWYDSFGTRSPSPYTRRFTNRQVRSFFPGCRITFNRICLHPQLSFRLGKLSWLACDCISAMLPFLNSMHFCVIQKKK